MIKQISFSYLEIFSAFLFIISTLLQAQEKIIAWCIAIISIIINIFILYSFTFYDECIALLIELGIGIYGWHLWKKTNCKKKI